MDRPTTFPAWLIVLLVLAGVAATVVIALLLSQLDSLQRRSQLPQEPLEIVDKEATLAASELTVVVIAGEDQVGTPLAEATMTSTTATQVTVTLTPILETAVPATATAPLPGLGSDCAFQPSGWVPYQVQEGDSLASLALRYGVNIGALVQANCLERESLLPGQLVFVPLFVPTRATQIACGVPVDWVRYTMRSGDTLFMLAQQRNTTVSLIMQANCLKSTYLESGTSLYVPPLPSEPDKHGPPDSATPQRWQGRNPGFR